MKREDEADLWDQVIVNLNAKGADSLRFGEMTYPYILAILTDAKAGKADNEADRRRRTLADFRSGRLKW